MIRGFDAIVIGAGQAGPFLAVRLGEAGVKVAIGLAIALIYLLFVILLGTLFFFIGPRTVHEARHLGEAWPSLTDRVNT